MTLRRLQFAAVVAVLSACFLAAGAVGPAGTAAATKAVPARAAADWAFEGCWTQWPAGSCRDVFRDAQGSYWICRACGTTGTPSTSKCSRTSAATLGTGYWCS